MPSIGMTAKLKGGEGSGVFGLLFLVKVKLKVEHAGMARF
jgi:hypothetical protein